MLDEKMTRSERRALEAVLRAKPEPEPKPEPKPEPEPEPEPKRPPPPPKRLTGVMPLQNRRPIYEQQSKFSMTEKDFDEAVAWAEVSAQRLPQVPDASPFHSNEFSGEEIVGFYTRT